MGFAKQSGSLILTQLNGNRKSNWIKWVTESHIKYRHCILCLYLSEYEDDKLTFGHIFIFYFCLNIQHNNLEFSSDQRENKQFGPPRPKSFVFFFSSSENKRQSIQIKNLLLYRIFLLSPFISLIK